MKLTLQIAAVIAIVWAFVLAFIIQEANYTAAIATNSLTYSAADFSAYFLDAVLLIDGCMAWGIANKLKAAAF